MQMQILPVMNPRGKLMPEIPPYTQESIARAKEWNEQTRREIARELGVPTGLWDFYEVYTAKQVRQWCVLIETLRS